MRFLSRCMASSLPISALLFVNAAGCVAEPSSAIPPSVKEEMAAVPVNVELSSSSPLERGQVVGLSLDSTLGEGVVLGDPDVSGGTECPPGTVETTVCDGEAAPGFPMGVSSLVSSVCWTECVPETTACNAEPSTGATVHSLHFPNVGDESMSGVAVDAAGNSILGIVSRDTINGGYTLLLRSVDPTGALLWSIAKPVSMKGRTAVAVTNAGDIVVAGNFGIYKFDAAGNDIWSRQPAAGMLRDISVAVDATGNIYCATNFYNAIDMGAGTLTSAGGLDILVVKFGSAGNVLWNKRFGATKDQDVEGIAVDSAGNLVLTGFFKGSLDFGGGALASNGTTSTDVFIAKLAPSGAHQWSQRFGDTSPQFGFAVAVDSADNIVFGGGQNGTANYGGGVHTSASSTDAFLVKLTSSGQYVWSKIFGGPFAQYTRALAVDACDNILMVDWNAGNGEGYSNPSDRGMIDLGGGQFWTSHSSIDVVVAKLDASGQHLYSHSFGNLSDEASYSIAAAPSGEAVIGYDLNFYPVDFGFGPVASAGSFDQVLVRFAP